MPCINKNWTNLKSPTPEGSSLHVFILGNSIKKKKKVNRLWNKISTEALSSFSQMVMPTKMNLLLISLFWFIKQRLNLISISKKGVLDDAPDLPIGKWPKVTGMSQTCENFYAR